MKYFDAFSLVYLCIFSDTTSAGWLSDLKSIFSEDSSKSKTDSEEAPSVPKLLLKMIEKNQALTPEILAILVGWSIVKNTELTIPAIFEELKEACQYQKKKLVVKCEKLWNPCANKSKKMKKKQPESALEAPKSFDNLSKFIFLAAQISEKDQNLPLLSTITTLVEYFDEIEARYLQKLINSENFKRNFLKSEFARNYLFTVFLENKFLKSFCVEYFKNAGMLPPKTLLQHFDTAVLVEFCSADGVHDYLREHRIDNLLADEKLLQKSVSAAPKFFLKAIYAKNPTVAEILDENEILKLCEFEDILEKEASSLSINILVKIINNGNSNKAKFLAARNIRNFAGIEKDLKQLFENSVMSDDFQECINANPALLKFTKVSLTVSLASFFKSSYFKNNLFRAFLIKFLAIIILV